MRKFASAVVATLGVAGVLLSAQLANADTRKDNIEVYPHSVKAGAEVQLMGDCTAPGFTSAPLNSHGVLEANNIELTRSIHDEPALYARTHVLLNAKPGTYTVSFKCGNKNVSTRFVVVPADQSTTTTKPAPAKKPAQVTVKPKGSANTGDGSTAE